MPPTSLPLPPRSLAARVGSVEGADPLRFYLEEGARLRRVIEQLLPDGWDWDSKRALDFGCGSARVMRHFAPEAEQGELWGCDIDARSIGWDQAHLSPPFRFFRSDPAPPLRLASESIDVVWAMSVFTHIADTWSAWLLELHRVLAPGGILIASFLGRGMWEPLVGEPYREDELGMTVLEHWEGPDANVFHSEWWLREHWGRAFDVLEITQPPLEHGTRQVTHSYIALRKRDATVSAADVERIDAGDARELAALQTSLRLARRELAAAHRRDSLRSLRKSKVAKRLATERRRLASRLRRR